MATPEETADFAALIRGLKERSGLSYGVLAKRLHMSTSTLHRYCNGDAVPTEYAPVERFARLCKATPEEHIEAHRLWILAAGARRRERKAAGTAAEPGTTFAHNVTPEAPSVTFSEPGTGADADMEAATAPKPAPRNRRRTALFAAAAVAVVLAATALVPRLVSGDGGGARKQEAGSVTSTGRGTPSTSRSASASVRSTSSPSDSASPSESATAKNGASASQSAPAGGTADVAAAVPLTVTTRPYAWESPCSQTYLVDGDAAKVPPPPTEQDAPSWVSALGAVSAGSQFLELTVQGTGQDTVVLNSLNVRVVGSGAPLAWNAYTMGYVGVGCGGGVPTHSFDVGLDASRPVATPKAGQTGLPYKVSESDPEVLYITAAAASHEVRWYLELAWTSGSRHGVLRIDDQGKPFRTSGMTGRPRYGYSLDKSEWIPAQSD
ncbi:helix-turn-helix domain-containing protein [Streptomyces sp. NPDC088350]|uniref:helix-turn-helix domain-containing protein n=1 Tax=Streptomyces sp. NPDC088350 TaxID=3365854 RepID=UPI0037FE5F21